jgi:hypothetical protein
MKALLTVILLTLMLYPAYAGVVSLPRLDEAKFKSDCVRNNGRLIFDGKDWTCVTKFERK